MTEPTWQGEGVTLYQGDCLEVMPSLSGVTAIVTDPPYGLSFMGEKWDSDVPSVAVWEACLAATVPGGHLLSFGGTRTYHRLVCAVEDAGFEIRDMVAWVHGQGFPKGIDVGKEIDRATDDAKAWDGYRTHLKPAFEPIVLARKPLGGTIVENCLEHGAGALNIDGCRIATDETPSTDRRKTAAKSGKAGADMHSSLNARKGIAPYKKDLAQYTGQRPGEQIGRYPANLIHDGSREVTELFPISVRTDSERSGVCQPYNGLANGKAFKQGATRYHNWGDQGSAARFFYCSKANAADRGPGNSHPTVKPTDLMRYLVKLVTMPGRNLILDPFMGSGTTGLACAQLGIPFVGIERDADSFRIARQRILGRSGLTEQEAAGPDVPDQLELF